MLYIKKDIVPNEIKRIFIVHGICEHSGRYDFVTKQFNDSGISVIRYDLRGHGKSEGKRGDIHSFKDHIEDLTNVINAHLNEEVKNVLFGHSMGALIGHMYMVTNPKVDYFIASGGPTDYLKEVKIARIIGYKWFGFLKVKNNFKGKLSHDTSVEDAYIADSLNLKKYKIRLAGEMFIKGVSYVNKYIYKNEYPILLLHGKEDKIVPYQMSKRILELIPSDDKRLIIYEEMYHEILNEVNKDAVMNDILGWLDER